MSSKEKTKENRNKERLWILKGSRDTLGRPGGGGQDSRSPSGVTQQSRGQTCPAPSVPRFPYREKVETTPLSLPCHIKALWEMQNAWPLQIHHLTSTSTIKMGRVEGNHSSCFQGWEAVNVGHSPRNLCPEDAVVCSTRCPLQFCEEAHLLENINVWWISTELKPCDPSFWVVLALCSAPPYKPINTKVPHLKLRETQNVAWNSLSTCSSRGARSVPRSQQSWITAWKLPVNLTLCVCVCVRCACM